MPKSVFPWPAGLSGTFPTWRNRHIASGDATPPARPAGVGDITNRIPYSEAGAASGPSGGSYDSQSRMVGLGEEARAPNFNRGLYELWGHVDSLFEKDDAVLDLIDVMGLVGTKYSLDGGALTEKLVYLGSEGTTTTTGGGNPGLWCSNYLKIRAYGGIDPLMDPATGITYFISNVHGNLAGAVSCYAALPTSAQVYPYGTCARIATVAGATLTFAAAIPPIAAIPSGITGNPVGLLNYSLLERILAGSGALVTKAFATSLSEAAGTYTTNRDGVLLSALDVAGAARWLVDDLVYTTHFVLSPVVCFNANVASMDVTLLLGTFSPAGRGPTERFMDLLRMADMGTALPLPITSTEPTGATYGSFDYANALFRAQDDTLKGTVGFDASMASLSPAPGGDWDAYAGFLHRRRIAFDNASTTRVPIGGGCDYDHLSGVISLGGGGFWDTALGADPTKTHLILGVDLVELYDALGTLVGLFVLRGWTGNNWEVIIEGLDGSLLPYPHSIVGGKLSICRPVFRTGGMLGIAASPRQGNLVIGDNFGPLKSLPALTLFTGGADFLLDGWAAPRDRRDNGTGFSSGRVFRVGCLGETCWGPETSDAGYTMSIVHSAIAGSEGGARDYLIDQTQPAVGEAMNVSFRKSTLFNDKHPFIGPIFTSYRVTPNTIYGLSKGAAGDAGVVKFAAGLLLGDPTFMFEAAAQNYNYAGVIAGGAGLLTSWPTGGVDQCMCAGMFVQRDRALGFGYPDLFAGIVENFDDSLPPVGDPASHRFQITWDDTVGLYRKINYGWSEARTFFHNIPMSQGQECSVTPNMELRYIAGIDSRTSWQQKTAGGTQHVTFPLNLPDGATITNIAAYSYSDAAGETWELRLSECPYDSRTTTAYHVGGPVIFIIGVNELSFSPNHVVNNSTCHYQIAITFGTGVGQRVELFGLRVRYTMQNFLPA